MRTLTVALIVVTAVTAGCGGESSEGGEARTLTIYTSLPLQGPLRANMVDAIRGARMALDERDGRVGTSRIRFVSLDDSLASSGNWDAGRVSANARRAAGDRTTIAYIGEANSGATAVSLPITNEAGLLQVSPGSTYGGLTRDDLGGPGEPDKYYPTRRRTFGRIIPADHIQARAVSTYLQDAGMQRLHLLHDRDTYGQELAKRVGREAEAAGLEETGSDGINVRAANFRGLADRVREADADAVFFGGTAQSQAAQVAKDVLAGNPDALLFVPDASGTSDFAKAVGRGLEARVRITLPLLPPDALPPAGRDFLARFAEKHGKPPEPFALYGYETMSVVLAAIERARVADQDIAQARAAVVRSFFETRDRQSVLGTYGIDEFGDTTLDVYGGYRIRAGAIVFDKLLSD